MLYKYFKEEIQTYLLFAENDQYDNTTSSMLIVFVNLNTTAIFQYFLW